MRLPKVSVIIVTKNRPGKLLRCVASLITNVQLPDEVVIIDSTNDKKMPTFRQHIHMLCRAKKIPLRYEQVRGKTLAQVRNLGIKKSRHEVFGFIDDDQIASENWIAEAKKLFSHPSIQVATGPKAPLEPSNYWNRVWAEMCRETSRTLSDAIFPTAGNSFYRRKYLQKNKIKFDERITIPVAEDRALFHQIYTRNEPVLCYKKLLVYDEFRTTLKDFAQQWYAYGQGLYWFRAVCIDKINQKGEKFYYKAIRIFRNHVVMLRSSSNKVTSPELQFGLFVKELVFLAGYFSQIFVREVSIPTRP